MKNPGVSLPRRVCVRVCFVWEGFMAPKVRFVEGGGGRGCLPQRVSPIHLFFTLKVRYKSRNLFCGSVCVVGESLQWKHEKRRLREIGPEPKAVVTFESLSMARFTGSSHVKVEPKSNQGGRVSGLPEAPAEIPAVLFFSHGSVLLKGVPSCSFTRGTERKPFVGF